MISRTHEVHNLIGGERVGAADGATFERRNPADAVPGCLGGAGVDRR